MKTIFLCPLSTQPRYQRRAAMFLANGWDVEVHTFERGLYTKNQFPEGVVKHSLGRIESGQYVRRFGKMLMTIVKLRNSRSLRDADLVYAFGLDMAIIALFSMPRGVRLVYEVGDLQKEQLRESFMCRVLKTFERMVLRRSTVLSVVTAGFLSDYFEKILPGISSKSIVFENRIGEHLLDVWTRPSIPKQVDRRIRIGYVGTLKYVDCIRPLIAAVAGRPDKYELHFFADGELRSTIQELVQAHDNIFFHGPFHYDSELPEIYSRIDVSYVVYDVSDFNVRVALPNKLFDNPFFGVPMIVADKGYMATRVKEHQIGILVDTSHSNFAEKMLDELNPELINLLSGNALKVATERLVNDSNADFKKLLDLLQV